MSTPSGYSSPTVTVAATLVWGLAGLTTVALIATVVVFGLLTAYAAGF